MPRNTDQESSEIFFNCQFCLRPEEIPSLPTVDEDGENMHPSDILEIYNDRRYAHYLNDFDSAGQLQEHLENRLRYWTRGSSTAFEIELPSVKVTVEWWGIARRARNDAKHLEPKQQQLEEVST